MLLLLVVLHYLLPLFAVDIRCHLLVMRGAVCCCCCLMLWFVPWCCLLPLCAVVYSFADGRSCGGCSKMLPSWLLGSCCGCSVPPAAVCRWWLLLLLLQQRALRAKGSNRFTVSLIFCCAVYTFVCTLQALDLNHQRRMSVQPEQLTGTTPGNGLEEFVCNCL